MRTALLIEDTPEYQLLVKAALKANFQVACAGDADEAEGLLAATNYDLILIDIGLPGRDGLSFCEHLRRNSSLKNTPILFISGRGGTSDLVQGFAAGADDYIHKPFHPEELKARVEARMRRADEATAPVQDEFNRADLHFSVGRQKVAQTGMDRHNRDLGLTPNEFKILYHLAKNEGRILTRAEILREVWGEELHVVERTVDKHICSLRRKMGSSSKHVVSVPGQGYQFSAHAPLQARL